MDYLALTCAQPRKYWATMTVTARMSPWCPEGLASSLSQQPAAPLTLFVYFQQFTDPHCPWSPAHLPSTPR